MSDQTNWIGSVWGSTTKGTVTAEIMRQANRIAGKITLFEPGLGQLQALLSGEWSDANKVTATLHQFTGNYSVAVVLPQTGKMDGAFDPAEGAIKGEWSTDAQTAGKFLLVKIESQQAIQPSIPAAADRPAAAPAQVVAPPSVGIPALITKTVVLGSYRLDEQAVRRLADLIKSGTNVSTPAINASYGEISFEDGRFQCAPVAFACLNDFKQIGQHDLRGRKFAPEREITALHGHHPCGGGERGERQCATAVAIARCDSGQ